MRFLPYSGGSPVGWLAATLLSVAGHGALVVGLARFSEAALQPQPEPPPPFEVIIDNRLKTGGLEDLVDPVEQPVLPVEPEPAPEPVAPEPEEPAKEDAEPAEPEEDTPPVSSEPQPPVAEVAPRTTAELSEPVPESEPVEAVEPAPKDEVELASVEPKSATPAQPVSDSSEPPPSLDPTALEAAPSTEFVEALPGAPDNVDFETPEPEQIATAEPLPVERAPLADVAEAEILPATPDPSAAVDPKLRFPRVDLGDTDLLSAVDPVSAASDVDVERVLGPENTLDDPNGIRVYAPVPGSLASVSEAGQGTRAPANATVIGPSAGIAASPIVDPDSRLAALPVGNAADLGPVAGEIARAVVGDGEGAPFGLSLAGNPVQVPGETVTAGVSPDVLAPQVPAAPVALAPSAPAKVESSDGPAQAPAGPTLTVQDQQLLDLVNLIATFQTERCLIALPRRSAGERVGLQLTAAEDRNIENFLDRLDELDPNLTEIRDKNLIDRRQCPALDFIANNQDYPGSRLGLQLADTVIASGGAIQGAVVGVSGLNFALMLVDDNGVVHDLSRFASVTGDTVQFLVPLSRRGSSRDTRLLLIAMAAPTPLTQLVSKQGRYAQDVFSGLGQNLATGARLAVTTIDLR